MQWFGWMVVGAVLALVGSGTAVADGTAPAAGPPTCSTAAVQGMQHEAPFDGHVIDLVVTAGGQRVLWFLRAFGINGFLERM